MIENMLKAKYGIGKEINFDDKKIMQMQTYLMKQNIKMCYQMYNNEFFIITTSLIDEDGDIIESSGRSLKETIIKLFCLLDTVLDHREVYRLCLQ